MQLQCLFPEVANEILNKNRKQFFCQNWWKWQFDCRGLKISPTRVEPFVLDMSFWGKNWFWMSLFWSSNLIFMKISTRKVGAALFGAAMDYHAPPCCCRRHRRHRRPPPTNQPSALPCCLDAEKCPCFSSSAKIKIDSHALKQSTKAIKTGQLPRLQRRRPYKWWPVRLTDAAGMLICGFIHLG